MIDLLKRHAIQVLRTAGHTREEIAAPVAIGKRTVQRVVGESMITDERTEQWSARPCPGRPSKAEAYRARVTAWLTEEPALSSLHANAQRSRSGIRAALLQRTDEGLADPSQSLWMPSAVLACLHAFTTSSYRWVRRTDRSEDGELRCMFPSRPRAQL